MSEQLFNGRLLPGERVVWSGRPGQGVAFSTTDILLIPFSIVWCGFAIFWTFMVARAGHGGAPFMVLWGLMFVCVGLYFVAGRFVLDAWVRRGTAYALTDRRILISRPRPFDDFTAVSLDSVPDARLSERREGWGRHCQRKCTGACSAAARLREVGSSSRILRQNKEKGDDRAAWI